LTGGGKGEGDFFHNLIHPSPLSSPARGEDFILLQFKISVQVSVKYRFSRPTNKG
jgi:hypothetical protein